MWGGGIYRLMVDRGFVWDVCLLFLFTSYFLRYFHPPSHAMRPSSAPVLFLNTCIFSVTVNNKSPHPGKTEEFAMLEASYAIVRIIQIFPNTRVPANEPDVEVGKEKQVLTLVVASGEGCWVEMSAD